MESLASGITCEWSHFGGGGSAVRAGGESRLEWRPNCLFSQSPGTRVRFFISLAVLTFATWPAAASPLNQDGRLVEFQRDIAPIFRHHCLECHGAEKAKNGFRIDQAESVGDYIEPGDAESSSMFVDYMLSDDPDMLMPPASHGSVSPGELALVRVWLNEGADWPDGATVAAIEEVTTLVEPVTGTIADLTPANSTIAMRAWMAQGFLHPATVHFPIALLLLGGGFVVAGWKWPAVGTQIPLACLLIGAASAIAASMMGWSFAGIQGYGSWQRMGSGLTDQPTIVWHRWGGVTVTFLAVASALVALWNLRRPTPRTTKIWKTGLLMCALLVGAVGHQGGELTYGEDLYADMFRWVVGGDSEAAAEVVEATDG